MRSGKRHSSWRTMLAGLTALSLAACTLSSVEIAADAGGGLCPPGVWAVAVRSPEQLSATAKRPLERGEAAKRSAVAGAGGSVYVGARLAGKSMTGGGPIGLLLAPVFLVGGIVLAPVAAVVGAATGAAVAGSPEGVATAEANMQRAFDEHHPVDGLAVLVITETRQRAHRDREDCGDAELPLDCTLADGTMPDILVRLTWHKPSFQVEGEIRPVLRLVQRLSADIIAANKAETGHKRAWLYRGNQHDFFALADDDARLLRAELAAARATLVDKAVGDLFVARTPERHSASAQPDGSVWTVLPAGKRVPSDFAVRAEVRQSRLPSVPSPAFPA